MSVINNECRSCRYCTVTTVALRKEQYYCDWQKQQVDNTDITHHAHVIQYTLYKKPFLAQLHTLILCSFNQHKIYNIFDVVIPSLPTLAKERNPSNLSIYPFTQLSIYLSFLLYAGCFHSFQTIIENGSSTNKNRSIYSWQKSGHRCLWEGRLCCDFIFCINTYRSH